MIRWLFESRFSELQRLKRRLARLEAEQETEEAISSRSGRFHQSYVDRAGEIAELKERMRQIGWKDGE